MRFRFAGFLLALVAFVPGAFAQAPLITEKKFFPLPQFTTQGGKPIKNVRVGYEAYGKLNAAGDNAVFVPHFFSPRKRTLTLASQRSDPSSILTSLTPV